MTRRTSSDTKRAATRLIWALSHRTTQSAMRMLSPGVVLACLLPCCRERVQSDSAEAGVSGTTPASEADSHAGGDRHLPIIRRAASEVSMNRELGMDLLGRLPGLSNAELNALLEAVNARTNEVQAWLDSILTSMAGSIGLEDPRKGLELAADIGDIQARSGVVAEIIGRLAQADPREALAQLELLSVRDLQHVLTRSSGLHGSSIIEDMARTNTDAMLKLVNKLPLTDRTLEVFSRAISTATGDDVSRAYEMIVSFPPGDTRNRLMERYAQTVCHLGRQPSEIIPRLRGRLVGFASGRSQGRGVQGGGYRNGRIGHGWFVREAGGNAKRPGPGRGDWSSPG